MARATAGVGSAAFFVIGPGTVAGLVPWALTGWEVHDPTPFWPVLRAIGVAFVLAGLAVLVVSFARFVSEGAGTPVPVAAPRRLVIGGLYSYVRNPMYVALMWLHLGQALIFGQFWIMIYTVAMWAFAAVFVRVREEPVLRHRFGAEYDAYRQAVPAWWPRLRPGRRA